MRFTQTVFTLSALASAAYAQVSGFDAITSPGSAGQTLIAGSSFQITWEPTTFTADTNTVSIFLLAGNDPTTLQPAATPFASSIKNSAAQFTWTVPSSTAVTYGFKIQLDSDPATFQYSFPFHISGGSTSSSSLFSTLTSSASAVSTSKATTKVLVGSTSSAASATVTAGPSSTANATASSVVSQISDGQIQATGTPAGNLSTTFAISTASGATKTVGASGSAAASTSKPATATGSSSASANIAQGGLALFGGLLIAFAL